VEKSPSLSGKDACSSIP